MLPVRPLRPESLYDAAQIVVSLEHGEGKRSIPSNADAAAIADRPEYSTVNTTSSASSQNWPIRAGL
jgi:hypothetical protein